MTAWLTAIQCDACDGRVLLLCPQCETPVSHSHENDFICAEHGFVEAIKRPIVPKLWPGETVVLLGGGPSLTPEDVNYVRGKARVIAIKEAYELAPWADALYAADSWWWHYAKGAPSFKGLKFGIQGRQLAAHDGKMGQFPDVTVLRDTGDDGLELDPTGLRTGYNSGYQAVNLAVHFGAARILLLGFDCWGGVDGRPNWHRAPRHHLPSPYPMFLQAFASLPEPLQAAGVAVVNCSRRTLLKAFPCVQLEEALP